MKNYLIKKAKKSVSLMMALLMLMSCWVWVAPTKAEAADSPDEGWYYVQVYGDYEDWTNGTGVSANDWQVTYKQNNGTGTEGTVSLSFVRSPQYANDPGLTDGQYLKGIVIAAGWVNGFPTKVHHDYNVGCDGDSFAVRPTHLYVGSVKNESTASGVEVATYNDRYTCNSDGGYDIFSVDLSGDKKPAPATVRNVSDVEVTIPDIGGQNNISGATLSGDVYDQYGVKLLGKTPDSYYLADAQGALIYEQGKHGVWVNSSNKIEVSDLAQKAITGDTVSGTSKAVYIYGKCGDAGSDGDYAGILTLKYPKYTMSVDQNGSISGLGASMDITDSNGNITTQTNTWSLTGIYGATPTTWPTGTASKEGYTFKGFWSVKQPTTGNASYNAFESEFAVPVSSDDFVNKYGGTAGGTYVTKEGVEYFNAGSEWDPSSEGRKVNGGTKYYGWWISTDVPVKFYDIDGKYIGTKTFKYGMKPAAGDYLDPTEEYEAGAYTYKTFSGTWMDIRGIKVTEGTYTFGPDGPLTLTPTYSTKTYKAQYTISFINPVTGGSLSNENYDYRYVLGAEIPKTVTIPAALAEAYDYSYEFAGWSALAPANGKYHVIAADDTVFELNEDWTVREDATYYPVLRSTIKEYIVNFVYTDTTGAQAVKTEYITFGSAITTPDYVNRTYASEGMGYNLEGWKYVDASGATVSFDADSALVFNRDNVYMSASNYVGYTGAKTPITFTAAYDEGTPMPYTVTFKYKAADGDDLTITAEVNNKDYITQDTVDKLDVPATYDDGTALYTFANQWKVTEGIAAKEVYTKNEFTSFSPTSHVTFEAVYDEGVPFYTVTYTDGASTYSERILKGENVPAWLVDSGEVDANGDPIMQEYVPEDYEGETGTYKFAGWYDEKQTDETLTETNGTKYTTADKVNGDLTLYAQYKFEPFKYTIKFLDYTGTVQLGIALVEAGQSFADAFWRANRAAQYRAPDDTYTYEFIGWDQPYNEDNLVCEGKDVTYIAQYRPSYIYYDAHWYNDEAAMNADADPLTTTQHTYNSRVYNPSVVFTAPEAADGYTNVFAGWFYKDANGAEQAFVRGMNITAEMKFYAKYTAVKEAHTVTAVVGGVSTEYSVKDNETAKAVPTPIDEYVDATSHKNFAGWYTTSNFADGSEFDIDTAKITEDITIYAKYDTEKHDKSQKQINSVPSYYAKGSETIWCACSKEETKEDVEIPMLTDKIAPTGTIYLGAQGKWSSTDAVGAAATDGDPVSLYANDDTEIILTINDTGDVDTAYNPSGLGKGIRMIRGFISTGVYSQDNQTGAASEVVTIFEDTTEAQNNVANYVIKLGEYTGLVDGETYIAYYYAVDKAGNVLNKNVRTAKFIYDTTAPEFEITGTGNEETKTYCEEAKVEGIAKGDILTINGTVLNASYVDGEDLGSYVIDKAGNYVITVADKAGNKTTKKIRITDGHTIVKSQLTVTCEADGYYKETCAVCNAVLKNEVTKTEGHKWVDGTPVAATCTENAKTVKTCSVCGKKEVTEIPDTALGHDYAKDADGNIIYTVVTEATCKTVGKKIANCVNCGGETIEVTIPVDPDAHIWGGIKTQKATCTQAGKTYKTCKYCLTVEDIDSIPATGHKETYKVVVTAATCGTAGVEAEKCKKCDVVISTAEIPATNRHIVYETDRKAPTATEKGYIKYGCKTCDWTKTEEIDTLKLYDVTFVGEDGTTVLAVIDDVVVGTTITADYTWTVDGEEKTIPVPTKEDSTLTYSYKFAGWKADGKVVTLPFDVDGDITLQATFTQSTIIYTHKFMVPTKWITTLATDDSGNIEFATIMGAKGDTNKKPVATPTFTDADEKTDADLKKIYTFKFLGWSTTGAVEDIVTDFTIEGDATFYAVFEAVPIKYSVIFYKSSTEAIWSTEVDGGETVVYDYKDAEGNIINPTKAYDNDYHYTFDKWCADEGLKNAFDFNTAITATTRIYAKYDSQAHNKAESEVTQHQNCVLPEITEFTCSCGYKWTEQTKDAKGHTPAENAVTEKDEDGVYYSVVYCTVCNAEISRTKTSVTVTFKNYNGARLDTQNLNVGEAIVYGGATPTRDPDPDKTYTFVGWFVEGDKTETAVTFDKATADVVYVAKYESAVRTFRVSYVDKNNTVLETFTGIAYGADVPAYTKGVTPTNNDYTTYVHYVFEKWGVAEDAKVTSDLVIKPVFTAVDHTLVDSDESYEPTCDEPGGTGRKCTGCDYKFMLEATKPAKGHSWDAGKVISEPDHNTATDGEILYTCTVCKKTRTEVLKAESVKITINVVDNNGKAIAGATVKLHDSNKVTIQSAVTDANGTVTFIAPKGTYTYSVEFEGETVVKDQSASDGNNTTPGIQTEPECSCSCHRDGFWGIIFRFFHKIIKIFTKKIGCCSCPDPRY